MDEIIKPEDSTERLLTVENFRNVFKQIFNDSYLIDTKVCKGSKSSANIYVNKKFEGKRAIVILLG